MRIKLTLLLAILLPLHLDAMQDQTYRIASPDSRLCSKIFVGESITWNLSDGVTLLMDTSPIAMCFSENIVFGEKDRVRKVHRINNDQYNEMTLSFKEFDLVFRLYNDGLAYRFVSKLGKEAIVLSEKASFSFPVDAKAWIAYVKQHTQTLETQFWNSFENTYEESSVSCWDPARMAFLPTLFEVEGRKLCVTEADLRDYPGMYLYNGTGTHTLEGRFAPYPDEVIRGGWNHLEMWVKSRKDYIAKVSGSRAFPWRTVIVAREDKELLACDMVSRLASPSPEGMDFSWVRPGKVAWEWWNSCSLSGVDFVAGVNTQTYKYYVDFAASQGVEYVILDGGWYDYDATDFFAVIPDINLPEIVSYAGEKGVGVILWAGCWVFERNMEEACRVYSQMGVKGFKIDFLNRDDQLMIRFMEDAARTAAKYHLVLDFHGACKPAGLQKTYPNVLNYEGVFGLEQLKIASPKGESPNMVKYDVTMPFIRQVAGPVDYTQGAMLNANKENFRAVYSEPMSQGTRCRQLAEYVVFDSPLNMMCDSPSHYLENPECTEFIASIPTVWDETVPLDGMVGEYLAVARRSGDKWYVAAMTDWEERDVTLELPVLSVQSVRATLWKDGPNASRVARDYKKTRVLLENGKMKVHLAPGGACVLMVDSQE